MSRRGRARWLALPLAAAALLLGALGCGSSSPPGDRIARDELDIYVSVPLYGTTRPTSLGVLRGAELAVRRRGGAVGRYRIRVRPLDDSLPQSAGWDPGKTAENARLVAQDPRAVAYVGDLDSGASAVALPVLERMGIAQLSPLSAAVGLTRAGAGASPGEPQRYYPAGLRTFARVVPDDSVQAAVQVKLQQGSGCRRTFVLDDGLFDTTELAGAFLAAASRARLQVLSDTQFDPAATDFSSLTATVAASGADCVMISGRSGQSTTTLIRQVMVAMPRAKLFATAAVTPPAPPRPGPRPRGAGPPSRVTPSLVQSAPALPGSQLPASGRAFFASYARAFGSAPPREAIFGFEAMSLVLDAIDRATGGGRRTARRSQVLRALFAIRGRDSVLGPYHLTSSGDTTLRRFGAYRLRGSRLIFWRVVEG